MLAACEPPGDSGGSGGTDSTSTSTSTTAGGTGGDATSGSGGAGGGSGGGSTGTGAAGLAPLCSEAGAAVLAPATPDPETWYRRIRGPEDQASLSITVDGDDNVVVAGDATGVTDFGGGPVEPIGETDLFVAKYDPSGALLWAKRFGGGAVMTTAIVADSQGNIAVTGRYWGGPLVIGATELEQPGESDLFVAELGPDGAPRWARAFGEPGVDRPGKLAVAPGDDIVLATADALARLLLVRISAQGDLVFETARGEIHNIFGHIFAPVDAVRVDAHGDIYLTGITPGGDLGNGFSPQEAGEIYVAKYAGSTGDFTWERRFRGTKDGDDAGQGQALVVVGDDVVIGGAAVADTDLGGGPLSASCDTYAMAFLARLSGADGAVVWSRALSTWGANGTRLFLDPAGHVVMVADMLGPTDLGGGLFPGDHGTYSATYDAETGTFLGSRDIVEIGKKDGPSELGSWGIATSAIDSKGRLVLQNNFFGTYTSGEGLLTSDGWGDVLFVRLPQ